jgi:short-subunit dehydrogenase
VNLLGVAHGVQAFVPRMLRQGRPASVINTASMAGIVPTAKMAPYCASKYGVVGLSEALNAELSKKGIHVSAICPGIIDTPIIARGIMRGEATAIQKSAIDFYAKHGASPEEVAQAVLAAIARPRLIVPVPRRHQHADWAGSLTRRAPFCGANAHSYVRRWVGEWCWNTPGQTSNESWFPGAPRMPTAPVACSRGGVQ